ncbi:MAG: abortive infection family protein [Chitinophagales bacterium]
MTDLKIKLETLQNLLIAIATGGSGEEDDYKKLRDELIHNSDLKSLLPDFLQTNRTTAQFWQFIKFKFPSYAERRNYIWTEFSKSLNYVEYTQKGIIDDNITKTIEKFNQEYINAQWLKALERKIDDPEGAITTARTLIETTCKFILDDINETYKDDIELPKLYKLTAEKLNLAPDQHTEQIFKQILGGCQTVVEGLGALRNKLSDSHGKKISQSKPTSRHAELAVNLAGTMTTFLLETYEFKTQQI